MERDKLKPCAYSVANVFSKFSMSWIYPVLKVGHKRKLKITDLYKVADEHQSAHLCEKLEKNWKEEVRQAEVAHRQPSLFRTTLKTYFPNIVLLSTILVIAEVLKGCGPILIGELTRYFNNYKNLPLWQGYTYATGIAATALLAPYCYQCFFILIPIIGWNMRTAMVALMYKKTLKLSQEALLKTTSGNIINLSSTDVIRFDLMFHYAPFIWIAPIEAAVVIYILWRRLGPSPLVGMGVLLFIMILQSYNGKLFGKLRLKIAKLTDSRVALMNEIISGMRIIKMYSWENAFRDMALSLRKKEIRKIMLASLLRSFNLSMSYSASQILTYTTFMVYVGLNGSLTTEAVFVAIGLFTVIRLAVGVFFPVAIEKFAEGTAAIRRIEAFLLLPEKETITGNIDSGEPLVSFENYTGSWIKDKPPALSDVSLKLNERRLLTVVGAVGSGKTSLLSAVLGELSAVAGEVKVVGKVGYCSQVAWLFADTIRENILFGETFNPDRYSAVVEACSLQKDFDILPSGDQTLIGERGVTLSGGQKARISLARIAYRSDLDIILLDDPLSAVDPLVAEHLFTKCICGFMKDKIRILVTHQLQFLSRAEQILSLKEGKVADMGLFEELQKREMDFASLAKPKVEKGIKQSVRKKILKRSISRMSSIDLGEFTTCYPSSFDFEIPFVTTEEDEMFFEESIDQSGQSFGSSTYPADVSDDLQQPSKNMNNHNNKKVVEEEDEIKGIGIKVYYQYIALGINLVYTLCYLFVTIGTHVILILSDWWIATWAFLEEQQSNALVGDIALMNITNQMMRNLTSAVNFTTGEPLANATSSQPPFNRQYYWIIYSFLTPCFVVAMFIRCVMHFYLCLSSNVKLHSGMLSAVFKAKIRFFDTHSVGSVLNRFSKDLGQIDELLPAAFIDFIFFSMTTLGIICYVISVNYFVPIVVIPMLIYFVKVRQFFVKSFREIKRIEGTNRSPVFSHLSNTLQGLFTIRTLGMQKKFIDKYDKLQDLHGASWFAFLSASRWLSFRLDTLTGIFVSFVAYFSVIIVLYLPNTPVNASTIGLTLTYCINMLSTIQWMVRQSAEVESAMTSVERIREYHNIPAESGDKNEKKDIPSGWPEKGIVSFENVSYAHFKDGPLVLKNLNLKFKAKEKVGIVGRTGAGKSSLISTLFRLSDQISGEITIDGIDTSQINLNELRGSLAIIPQDPMLFSGTIRTNLDMFSSYTDQQLWDTLEQVQLKSVVEAFPMKMETELAESGSNFSVGQRQLVCLARAILRKNRILIIDEATANVDINTDRLIQETIRKEFAHCTVFTIAHRLNTIIDSDRILFLDAGCVVEFGEPHVLLQKKGGSFDEMIRNTGDEEVKLRNMAKKTYLEKNAIQEKAET